MKQVVKKKTKERQTLGWREWVTLPDLDVPRILAKVDTGAKTCALHTFFLEEFEKEGVPWIRFSLHPKQNDTHTVVHCETKVKDRREVTDSGGHTELRYVIETGFIVGKRKFKAEVTLTNRDNMKYRILLGRNALRRRFVVDPSGSHFLQDQNLLKDSQP